MAAEEILRDHSDSAILIASEESLMTFWHRTIDASSIYRGEDMLRVYTGFSHPLLNPVCCPRFGERSAEKQVSKVIDFFRTRGVPHSWWIGASSTPERLEEILIENGQGRMGAACDGCGPADLGLFETAGDIRSVGISRKSG